MVQDDAPCACGGERITLVAARVVEPTPVSVTAQESATAATALASKSL
jgi:hypothetical protein